MGVTYRDPHLQQGVLVTVLPELAVQHHNPS